MRYYKLVMTTRDGKPIRPSSLDPSIASGVGLTTSGTGQDITSLGPSGQVNPAALKVEFDIPIYDYVTPGGQAFIRVWGLSLADVGQSFNLNGALVSFYGGMSKGLPLAKPEQQGLLVKGRVFQAFGNWVGTDQSVDLYLTADTGTVAAPMNYSMNWKAGDTLDIELKNTLGTALPGANLQINIQQNLQHNHTETGVYGTLEAYSKAIYSISKSIVNDPNYAGVTISQSGDVLVCTDLTQQGAITKIAYEDIIGQPTWKAFNVVECKVVLRSGIRVGQVVNLPAKTILITNSQALSSLRQNLTFSGNYYVRSIHHYGDSRQQDAASWNTTLDLIPLTGAQAGGNLTGSSATSSNIATGSGGGTLG